MKIIIKATKGCGNISSSDTLFLIASLVYLGQWGGAYVCNISYNYVSSKNLPSEYSGVSLTTPTSTIIIFP